MSRRVIISALLSLLLIVLHINASAQDTPQAPTNLQVTFNDLNNVAVFWINTESDYDALIVERRNMGTDNIWYPVMSLGGATVLATDNGLVCQGAYFYRVYGVRDGLVSDYSNEGETGLIECEIDDLILVQDGGFEVGNLSLWQTKNLTGDKVQCDKLKEDYSLKEFSNTGRCAFRFKGSEGENSKIGQKPEAELNLGYEVILNAFVRAKNLTEGVLIKAVFVYSEASGLPKTVSKLQVTPGTYDYTELEDALVIDGTVEKIKFQIINKASSGKVYFDDVTMFAVK